MIMPFLLHASSQGISSSSVPAGIIQSGYSMSLQRKSSPTSWRYAYRPPKRHLVRTIVGHTDWVRYAVPSDDGRLLASASKDQVLCLPNRFVFLALKDMHNRLLDSGIHLRVNKRWCFGATITKSKLLCLPRLRRTMPFASLQAFRFVHVALLRISLTLHLEYRSGEEAWHVCRHGLKRQDNQALGHTERPNAKTSCRVHFSVAHQGD